ncbi:hypothetical protein FGO68_gene11105 [Halteria grandinella]|uniref:Uncharacterized protein n=1 Tax=Halteria grandinella TaxID=5974 RepID=A0A8J8NV41_HALGN|nr:hypothetical protein FGO68_gene11105 [Halteria grandinella]
MHLFILQPLVKHPLKQLELLDMYGFERANQYYNMVKLQLFPFKHEFELLLHAVEIWVAAGINDELVGGADKQEGLVD